MEESKDNRFVIIVKIEKYIEYMLTILLKLPRTEKFSIGTEVKTSMYEMLKNILLASKIDKSKRLQIYTIVDSNIYYQRICIRMMYNQNKKSNKANFEQRDYTGLNLLNYMQMQMIFYNNNIWIYKISY